MLEDYNKHKWDKYGAGTGEALFFMGVREGSLEDILTEPPNTTWNLPERKKDFPQEEAAWTTVWRGGTAGWEVGMAHNQFWAKSWGRRVGSEAGEVRGREAACLCTLPLPPSRRATLRRSR